MRVITGSAKGHPLLAPRGRRARPTTDRIKEALFSILSNWIPGAHCLDLFAGSGALGIEALSRGAASCLFVEQDSRVVRVIRANLQRTHLEAKARVWRSDAMRALKQLALNKETFSLVFLDPPYGQAMVPRCLETISTSGLLIPQGQIVAEVGKAEDLPLQIGPLYQWRRAEYSQTALCFFKYTEAGSKHENSHLSRHI